MKKFYEVISIVTIVFFSLSFIFSLSIGGDALNGLHAKKLYPGYVEGNYYIASHGDYTMVTKFMWYMSYITEIITIILFVIMVTTKIIVYVHHKEQSE